MKYEFTAHAKARIAERKVPAEWLRSVLEMPQRTLSGKFGREIKQSEFERDGKRWLVRAVVEGNLVLTVLLTSKVEKYGGAS